MNLSSLEALAESRRVLRAILTRRDFLTVSGSIAGLALAGCGSTDAAVPTGTTAPPVTPPLVPPGPVIPEGLSPVSGTISLPAGSTLKLTDLSVDVGCQIIPVSSTGTFTAGVSTSGPSLALLTDTSSNGVLMSMFTANGAQTISARSTAVTLIYYATSAYALPASAMPRVLALINSDPAIAALEAVVASAVAVDPHAIINNAAPLGPAIALALRTIFGSAPILAEPEHSRALVHTNTQTTVHANALIGVPTLLKVDPSSLNGVTVNQDDNAVALLISNAKRRGCKVYVYQVSNIVDGKTETKNPVVREIGPINLASTESMSLMNLLKDITTLFAGSSPFQPVNLPAIPLILKPSTADRTDYAVIVIASSWRYLAQDALEPAFYRMAPYSQEVPMWREDALSLFLRTLFGDVLLPLLCFASGIGAMNKSEEIVSGVISKAKAANSSTFAWIMSNLKVGSLGQIKESVQTIITDAFSSDLSTQFWKSEIQEVIGLGEARALREESRILTQSRWLKGAKMFQKLFPPLFAAGAVAEAWDLGAVLVDSVNSDIAGKHDVTLIRQKLGLLPIEPRIAAGETVNFTVDLPLNVTGTYTYEWTQTSLFAKLSAVGESNIGSAITTTKRAVNLVTSGSDANPVSVLVIGYDTRTSPRTEIGRAGTTVSFLYPTDISPANATLLVKQTQVYVATINGQLPTDAVYKWTVVGTAGTFGAQTTRTTSTPQVTFNAGDVPGSASVQLEVVNTAGLRWAKREVPVAVEFPAVIVPSNVTLGLSQQQVYSVVVTGQLPVGIVYKWTLTGQAGTLAGQPTQTTNVPQVNFIAGTVPGTATLHVDVVTAAGVRWAKADASIVVARAPSISITLAGPWDSTKQPPNGTYNYPSAYDGRVRLESEPALDQIGFAYNVGHDNSIGVFVAIHVPTGSVIKTGDTFTKYAGSVNSNGTFQFLMSNNQTDADAPNARQYVPDGPGTLRLDDVTHLVNGQWSVNYSLTITNAASATVVAAGAARWS